MAQPQKFRDLMPTCNSGQTFVEYQNLLMNGVKITNVDYKTEVLIKKCLFNGQVAYDKLNNKWANVSGIGIDDDGFPTMLNFVFQNGKTYRRKAYYEPNENGAYIIFGTPAGFSFNQLIEKTSMFMENCDKAIMQNIDACKTPFVVAVNDENLQESLEQAIEKKKLGQPVIMVDEGLADGIKTIDFKAEYLADKFTTLKYDERDRLLNKLGIMSANTDKRERVQVGEVNATLNQCSDYIYLLIDTFNKQMETYGLDFRMEANGSLEELYLNDIPEQDTENEKVEEKETEINE